MVFIPNKDSCINNDNILNTLIVTNIIKANTIFNYKSCYMELLRSLCDFYRGKIGKPSPPPSPSPSPSPSPPPKPKPLQQTFGGVYLVYLGCNLYKFGKVTNFKNINKRCKSHLSDSKEKIVEFCNKTVPENYCWQILTIKTSNPAGAEEAISNLIRTEGLSGMLTAFPSTGDSGRIREYFVCTDINYVMYELKRKIDSLNL
jgi:hypothetical protein